MMKIKRLYQDTPLDFCAQRIPRNTTDVLASISVNAWSAIESKNILTCDAESLVRCFFDLTGAGEPGYTLPGDVRISPLVVSHSGQVVFPTCVSAGLLTDLGSLQMCCVPGQIFHGDTVFSAVIKDEEQEEGLLALDSTGWPTHIPNLYTQTSTPVRTLISPIPVPDFPDYRFASTTGGENILTKAALQVSPVSNLRHLTHAAVHCIISPGCSDKHDPEEAVNPADADLEPFFRLIRLDQGSTMLSTSIFLLAASLGCVYNASNLNRYYPLFERSFHIAAKRHSLGIVWSPSAPRPMPVPRSSRPLAWGGQTGTVAANESLATGRFDPRDTTIRWVYAAQGDPHWQMYILAKLAYYDIPAVVKGQGCLRCAMKLCLDMKLNVVIC